jgi:tetratricopeptide (TPR) repeat protein
VIRIERGPFLKENTLKLVLACVVIFTAFVFYIQSLTSGFIWDDLDLLFKPLKAGENPYSFLFGGKTFFRPVVRLLMAMDYSLWHMNPVGYHMTNIVLHMINSLLVFVLAYQFFMERTLSLTKLNGSNDDEKRLLWMSFFSAMIFAVLPIHIESVVWISGRTDLLATLFFLLAFLSFMIYGREGRYEALILSSIFFLFSLLSKENAIAFIGVTFIYSLAVKMQKRDLLRAMTSFLLALGAYFIFRNALFLIEKLTMAPGESGAFFARGYSSGLVVKKLFLGLGYYFGKLMVPLDLSLVPRFPQSPLYIIVFAVFILAGVLFFIYGRRFELFLLFWIIITLSPSLLIIFSRVSEPLAERYLYLPSVGFILLMGAFFFHITGRKKIIVIFMAIWVFYAVSGVARLHDWRSDLSIWEDTVQKNPYSFHANLNYSAALMQAGTMEKARKVLQPMLSQKGLNDYHYSRIYDLLGVIELEEGYYAEAEMYLDRSIRLHPRNEHAYYNLGLVYDKRSFSEHISDKKRKEFISKAIYNYKSAHDISPQFIQPQFNIGICYVRLDDHENAEKYLNMVIEADPQSVMAKDAARLIYLIKHSQKDKINELLNIKVKDDHS